MLDVIKWSATVVLIISVALNGLGFYPVGPIVAIVGGLIWLVAAIKMGDKPLIATNSVMTAVGAITVGYNYIV